MTAIEDPKPVSPCIRHCTLDDRNVCVGCGRTIDEIIRWQQMDDEERARVLARLRGRTPGVG